MSRDWFDVRALALAAVLALGAALPSITRSVESRDYYFFDVALTSTTSGTTQLFWDLGRGYREQDSSQQPLKSTDQPVVYRYMMPMGIIRGLRLDPVDGPGQLTLTQARIVDYRGRVIYQFSPAAFQAYAQIAEKEIRGDHLHLTVGPNAHDPILELGLPEPLHLTADMNIWLRAAWPVAWPVFLIGALLGTPAIARRLHQGGRRILAQARSRPGLAIIAAACLTVAVQSHPVIFFGRSFASPYNGGLMLYGDLPTLPGSSITQYTNTMGSDVGAFLFQHLYYPMVQRKALQEGELPLWNRYSLCGEPLLGQGQSMFGDPFNFITILADGAAWAWDLRFLIARWILVAATGSVVWQLTRNLTAALATIVAAGFLGFYTFRLLHPANFSVGYSAAILWAWCGLLFSISRRQQAGWLLALVAANWLVFTSGTMKEAAMLAVGLNLAGVLLICLHPFASGKRLPRLGLATVAGVIFLFLTAPGWLSFLVTWKHSFTSYDTPAVASLPIGQLIGFFDDIFYRQTTQDEVVLAPSLNFVFLLGILWWLVSPRLWLQDRAGLALTLAMVPPFAFAFGLIPAALIVKIPFVANIIHVGNTFSCVLMILGLALAGCGFNDALARLRDPAWPAHLARVLLVAAGLGALYFASTTGSAKSPFFVGYGLALAIAVVTLPIAMMWSSRHNRPAVLAVALGLSLPLLFWRHCQWVSPRLEYYAFAPSVREDIHGSSASTRYLDAQLLLPGRVVGWGNALFPSYNTARHWESLYGVDALRNSYYQELAIELGLQRVWAWDWFNEPADAPRLVRAHDMLNVTHYVADRNVAPRPIPGLNLLSHDDLGIYASPTAWPRAFFTDRLSLYAHPKDFAQAVLHGDGQPFAARQISETKAPALPADQAGRVVRAATDYRLTANRTRFTVEAPGPGLVVLTECYYTDDFRVTINGQPAEYFRVNHAFKGVAIPAPGRHEITFTYHPQHLTLALSLFAAGCLLLAMGFAWLWHRGTHAQPVSSA